MEMYHVGVHKETRREIIDARWAIHNAQIRGSTTNDRTTERPTDRRPGELADDSARLNLQTALAGRAHNSWLPGRKIPRNAETRNLAVKELLAAGIISSFARRSVLSTFSYCTRAR